MIFEKTRSKLFQTRCICLAASTVMFGLASQTAFADDAASQSQSKPSTMTTTDSTTPSELVQTLELRDSAMPPKTLDRSGLNHLEDPLSKKSTQFLEGVLTKDELTGRVTLSADRKTLTLYAVNHGKRALIFSGDEATVKTESSAAEKTLTRNEVISPPAKSKIPQDIGQVAVSIVSDGAIPAIFDFKTAYNPDGTAYYGKDQARRKMAERRFGQRTLFPGESTTGRVYLPEGVTNPTELVIPIIVHPSGESLGNIVLPVEP